MRFLTAISIVVGIALAGICGSQLRTRLRGNIDPVVRTIDELGAPDVMEKIHVAVTDFRPGSVLIVKASKGRKNAWAPLLRADGSWPARPVFAFLPGVADPKEAARQLEEAKVTGILGDSLPGNARDYLAVRYPDVNLAKAIPVRVGGSLPSLALHLTLFVVSLILIVGGIIVAIASTWSLNTEPMKTHAVTAKLLLLAAMFAQSPVGAGDRPTDRQAKAAHGDAIEFGQQNSTGQDAPKDDAKARALAAVHPRKFGAPGMIGQTRGWYIWKKWNPQTWEAEVTHDPPGEVFKVRVLPWATTYRHLSYGARFDDLLPGEKMNMFFDPDENHRRGYVVHFQDEISQMKGHGHTWKILAVKDKMQFSAQIFAGDKALDDKVYNFEIDPACRKWSAGKLVDAYASRPGDRIYLTWVLRDDRRLAMLLTDDASLETLKKLETQRIDKQIAAEGMAGRLEKIDNENVQFMIYSTYWAQAGQLKPGQVVHIATTGPGYRPTDTRFAAKVLSQKNRGVYGSGVNDVVLQLLRSENVARLRQHEEQVLRLIPRK